MSGRPSKKARRLSTDSEGTEGPIEWPVTKGREQSGRTEKATTARNESPQSMRLTVKTSSNKLREATRSTSSGNSGSTNSRDPFIGGQILEGKRARNVRKSYVVESEESEEEDEEMEDLGDDDAEGDEEDEDMDAEDDGLGDEDADGDIDMDIPPPPPVIKISRAQNGKQTITAKPVPKHNIIPVEQKEMQDGSDDEELSELESELGEEVEEEEGMQSGNEEDAEGEDEEIEQEEDVDEEDDMDSDDETPAGTSRASTPDISKLTKRQRARIEDSGSGFLLSLPDEVQVKKHLTAEEHAMRRAEMARRRKNLSEKRNEEEKMETINKLLKKQAPKTNARRRDMNHIAGEGTPDSEGQKANPLFVRWISNKNGNRIAVPEEWLDAPVGSIFGKSTKPIGNSMGGKLIQEVS